MWAGRESAKLLDRVLVYDGSFVPRFVRGSRSTLSNHAFGSAFDINAKIQFPRQATAVGRGKGLGSRVGADRKSLGVLLGRTPQQRPDGMHFEVASSSREEE
jgi:hypothetical protein